MTDRPCSRRTRAERPWFAYAAKVDTALPVSCVGCGALQWTTALAWAVEVGRPSMIILRRVGSDLSSGLLYECMGLPSLPQARTVGGEGTTRTTRVAGPSPPPPTTDATPRTVSQSVNQSATHNKLMSLPGVPSPPPA